MYINYSFQDTFRDYRGEYINYQVANYTDIDDTGGGPACNVFFDQAAANDFFIKTFKHYGNGHATSTTWKPADATS